MGKNEKFKIDMEDDIVGRAMVVYEGKINWPPKPVSVSAAPAAKKTEVKAEAPKAPEKKSGSSFIVLAIMGLALFLIGKVAPAEFLSHFTVFVLSCFIGWQVVWNVSHSLHTPLMSVTNAISGIIIIGGILHIRSDFTAPISILAILAVLVATINIAGGFFITHRMLKMFRR
jgi:NAD(P) transhydrogenase subunit alpha